MEDIRTNFQFKNMEAFGFGAINPNKNFIITGYFWGKNNLNRNSRDGKSTYGDLANRLANACKQLGVNHFIVEIPDLAKPGGYQIAINMKPEYILAIVNMFPGYNIVTIDTDMTLTGYPYIFESKDYDFMGFNWNNDIRNIEGIFPTDCLTWNTLHTSGGILVFTSSPLSKRLLERWAEVTAQNPGKAEDRTLSVAFNGDNLLTLLRCLWLPIEYFWIPYFYEFNINFQVSPGYTKIFKHIKFDRDGTSLKEYNFQDFYKIKTNSIKVFHPEALTSEELAAAQGAASNRVPESYYQQQVRKKRCIEYDSRFVNIPELYSDNTNIKNEFRPFLNIMESAGAFKVEKMPTVEYPEKFEMKYTLKSSEINPIFPLIVSICDGGEDEFIKKIPMYLRSNILLVKSKSKKYLPFILLKVIKSIKCEGILYINSNIKEFNLSPDNGLLSNFYDFQCFNDYAYPIFKEKITGKPCYDANVLHTLSTDVLAFKNNKYGVNLLKLWCSECKSGKNITDKLSKVFNKYMCAIFMRSKWISPETLIFKDKKVYRPKYKIMSSSNNLIFDTLHEEYSGSDIYDDLVQCGDLKSSTSSTLNKNYERGNTRKYTIQNIYGSFFI
jgi:hypothetical protein